MKETHLLIKNQLEGHGLAWNLSQMEVLVGATLALSLSSTGRLEFPTTLTTLLKPEGYPATLPKPRATHGSCTLPLPCQIQQLCLIPEASLSFPTTLLKSTTGYYLAKVYTGHTGNALWLPNAGDQEGLHSWVPWDCNNQWVWFFHQAVILRAQYRQQTEIYLSLSSRKIIFLELQPEGQAPGLPQV